MSMLHPKAILHLRRHSCDDQWRRCVSIPRVLFCAHELELYGGWSSRDVRPR